MNEPEFPRKQAAKSLALNPGFFLMSCWLEYWGIILWIYPGGRWSQELGNIKSGLLGGETCGVIQNGIGHHRNPRKGSVQPPTNVHHSDVLRASHCCPSWRARWVSPCPGLFLSLYWFNSHRSTMKYFLLLSVLFCKWRNWGTERLSILCEVTQPVSGGTHTWTQNAEALYYTIILHQRHESQSMQTRQENLGFRQGNWATERYSAFSAHCYCHLVWNRNRKLQSTPWPQLHHSTGHMHTHTQTPLEVKWRDKELVLL